MLRPFIRESGPPCRSLVQTFLPGLWPMQKPLSCSMDLMWQCLTYMSIISAFKKASSDEAINGRMAYCGLS